MINKKLMGVLLASLGLTSVLFFSSEAHATSLAPSASLPQAGFALVIDGGKSVKEVKEEVRILVEKINTSAEETQLAGTTLSFLNSTAETETEDTIQAAVDDTIDFDKEVVESIVKSESAKAMIGKDLEEDFTNLVIAQVNSYVNVRDLPDENKGKVVGKLYDDSVGNLLETTDNGWYKIQSGNCTGYVKAEYCVTGDDAVELAKEVGTLVATVNTTTLKVRTEPSTSASVLGLIPIEEELVVTEDLDDWVGVTILEGDGYVSKDYVDLRTEFVTAESKEEEETRLAKEEAERTKANEAARAALAEAQKNNNTASTGGNISINGQDEDAIAASQDTNPTTSVAGSGLGSQVANFALQFVGNPYVYGGTSLTNGADCSGFTLSVYSHFGVALPHSASAQRAYGYDPGGMANAQPGDLVIYSGHVGIYIGNGQIVHASTPRKGIIVGSAYYSTPLAVRRIF
jgi:cell wall-associated NlpC family hydrolase